MAMFANQKKITDTWWQKFKYKGFYKCSKLSLVVFSVICERCPIKMRHLSCICLYRAYYSYTKF